MHGIDPQTTAIMTKMKKSQYAIFLTKRTKKFINLPMDEDKLGTYDLGLTVSKKFFVPEVEVFCICSTLVRNHKKKMMMKTC